VAGISIRDSYELLDRWVVEVFRELGVPASYEALNDIASPEGKIGGAAQIRRPGVVLHHTTIAYQMKADDMLSVLRIGREKLSDKGIPSASKRVAPLRRFTDLPRLEIVDRLTAGFRQRFGMNDAGLGEGELAAARRLVEEKYGTVKWTSDLP
jgi:lipoate-protein ligase A